MSHDDHRQAEIISFVGAKHTAGGEFFVVDRRAFAAACGLGLNPAVAYLTIVRGAGSRPKSLWSVDAIERYTGISRPKAKLAVTTLVENGLLKQERTGTRPRYEIVAAHRLAEITLSSEDQFVLGLVSEGARVPQSYNRIALNLVRQGFLTYNRVPFPKFDLLCGEPQHIWLPNAIIEGAADEIPPIALLRQMQDVRALQLFLALYDNNDLPNDGGVGRAFLYRRHEVTKVGQSGASTIWGFDSGNACCSGVPPGKDSLHKIFLTGKLDQNKTDTGLSGYFDTIDALVKCGLLEFIPHIFESDEPEAEMLHAYAIREGVCEPWERSVAGAAHVAGLIGLTPGQQQWVRDRAFHLLPAPSHIARLTVMGIGRLRYRPQTRMTAAWFAKSKQRSEAWLMVYEKIARNNRAAG